jgi:hypothetical protein
VQLKAACPRSRCAIAISGENDLVVATFGRGFYVLDDYTPLRSMTEQTLAQNAVLFPVKSAPLYVESTPLGLPGASFQGHGYYMAANPPFGATFTYYLKDAIESRKTVRQKAEAALAKKNADVPFPAWDTLKVEDRQEDPAVVVTVSDANGQVVRRFTAPATAGIVESRGPSTPADRPNQRTAVQSRSGFPFISPRRVPPPGTYQVSLLKRVDGVFTALGIAALSGGGRRQRSRPRYGDARDRKNRGARARSARHIALIETFTRLGFQARDRRDARRGYIARAARTPLEALRDAQESSRAIRRAAEQLAAVTPRPVAGAIGNGYSLSALNASQRGQVDIVREFDAASRASGRGRGPQGARASSGSGGVPWTSGRIPRRSNDD